MSNILALERAKDGEQRLAEVEAELALLAKTQRRFEARLDQIETATDHFTVFGWHRYPQQAGPLSIEKAAEMDQMATQYCKQHEVEMGSVPDPHFGTATTYPKWVLDELFVGQKN